ncbi:hypothetical protein BS78_09G079700 [Paspalum vaginatum]|nr:hypothetical protein BS78_09G079700 [Paspalum vaginatum]
MLSHGDLSRASKHCLLVINASSHIIRSVCVTSSANSVPRFISQIDNSSISIGILNRECAIRPFGSNKEATPDDATVKTIFLCALRYEIILFHKKCFAGSSMTRYKEYIFFHCSKTLSTIL